MSGAPPICYVSATPIRILRCDEIWYRFLNRKTPEANGAMFLHSTACRNAS